MLKTVIICDGCHDERIESGIMDGGRTVLTFARHAEWAIIPYTMKQLGEKVTKHRHLCPQCQEQNDLAQ